MTYHIADQIAMSHECVGYYFRRGFKGVSRVYMKTAPGRTERFVMWWMGWSYRALRGVV